jgi:hypothetical protein
MLTMNEYKMLQETVQSMDAQFTDDAIDKAEFYDIEEDPITLQTTVTLYDINGGILTTAVVEDYDSALAYLEDEFDLEEYDPEDTDAAASAGSSRFGHA